MKINVLVVQPMKSDKIPQKKNANKKRKHKKKTTKNEKKKQTSVHYVLYIGEYCILSHWKFLILFP